MAVPACVLYSTSIWYVPTSSVVDDTPEKPTCLYRQLWGEPVVVSPMTSEKADPGIEILSWMKRP